MEWCYTHDVPKELRSDLGWTLACPYCPTVTLNDLISDLYGPMPETCEECRQPGPEGCICEDPYDAPCDECGSNMCRGCEGDEDS